MKYVLLVDHHLAFAKAFKDLFVKMNPQVEVTIADGAQNAFRHLNSRPCDLMIVDLHLPTVGGLQLLLSVREQHPSLTPLVMASNGSQEEQEKAKEYGSILYVEKPATQPDYEKAVVKIAEVLRQTPDVPRGGLTDLKLDEIREDRPSNDCKLIVFGDSSLGTIFIHAGRVIHIETAAAEGAKALQEMLSWKSGQVERRDHLSTTKRTLDLPWQDVFVIWAGEQKKDSPFNSGSPDQPSSTLVETQQRKVSGKEGLNTSKSLQPVLFDEEFIQQTGIQFACEMDRQGKIQREIKAHGAEVSSGVILFVLAKIEELSDAFGWGSVRSVHTIHKKVQLAFLPDVEKIILLGWPSDADSSRVPEAINTVFKEELVDPIHSRRPRLPGTLEVMKKIPGLHGYAIFNREYQILVRNFSKEWRFELLQATARIMSQMGLVFSLEKLPMELIQVKFEKGSVFAKSTEEMLLLVICHSQTKVPLLKDCMLRLGSNEIQRAIL